MKIYLTEDHPNSQKIAEGEIPYEDYKDELEAAVDFVNRARKLKGFRPGKAPTKAIETNFPAEIRASLWDSYVRDALVTELTSLGTEPLTGFNDPEWVASVGQLDFGTEKPLKFRVTFDVAPEFELPDFSGISATRYPPAGLDRLVDDHISMLRYQNATMEPPPPDYEARNGDEAEFSYTVWNQSGKEVKRPKNDLLPMTVHVGRYEKNISPWSRIVAQSLLGRREGDEYDYPVEVPENILDRNIAGKTVTCKVKVTRVRMRVLSQLDDAFARSLNCPEIENLETLRDVARKEIYDEVLKQNESLFEEQIFSAATDLLNVNPPLMATTRELRNLAAKTGLTEQDFEAFNKGANTIGSQKVRTAQENAKRLVLWELLSDKIIDQEGLMPGEGVDAVSEALLEFYPSISSETEKARVRDQLASKPENLNQYRVSVARRRAIKYIAERANVNEVSAEEQERLIAENERRQSERLAENISRIMAEKAASQNQPDGGGEADGDSGPAGEHKHEHAHVHDHPHADGHGHDHEGDPAAHAGEGHSHPHEHVHGHEHDHGAGHEGGYHAHDGIDGHGHHHDRGDDHDHGHGHDHGHDGPSEGGESR
ncbi:MAG: trigger factor [Deltaproteobacteria bacterium]|jgi:trigger factor|nr:trigger factor [Deltaproteobacteria bacterium]